MRGGAGLHGDFLVVRQQPAEVAARGPFTFLGAISYSLYLLHQAIGFTLIWRFEMAGFAPGTAGLCAALVVTVLATLLTYLIERPAMRMIRDAWKKRRPTVAPA